MLRVTWSALPLVALLLAALGLAPGPAQAAVSHSLADWNGLCEGNLPLGNSELGTTTAEISWNGGLDGVTGDVWGFGVSSTAPNTASYVGELKYEGTGPLAGSCALNAGAINTQQYSVRNLLDPTALTAELNITFQLEGRFEADSLDDFDLGGARFGIDAYLPIDPNDPINGPRTQAGNAFCQTGLTAPIECSNFEFDLSGLQIQFASDAFIFSGSISGNFDVSLDGDPVTIGVTTFSGLSLNSGIDGPISLRSDFGDTVTWQITATDPDVEILPVPEPGTAALLGLGVLGLRTRSGRRSAR